MEKDLIFNHEKLKVYQTSIEFVAWLTNILEQTKGNRNVTDQIYRASISTPLNIAEGNGKTSKKDHNRFLEFTIGSALECATCLDVMRAKKIISHSKMLEGKRILMNIVRMLYKLWSTIKQ